MRIIMEPTLRVVMKIKDVNPCKILIMLYNICQVCGMHLWHYSIAITAVLSKVLI